MLRIPDHTPPSCIHAPSWLPSSNISTHSSAHPCLLSMPPSPELSQVMARPHVLPHTWPLCPADTAVHSSFVKRSSHPVSSFLHISLCWESPPGRHPRNLSSSHSTLSLEHSLAPAQPSAPRFNVPPLEEWLQISASSPDPLLSLAPKH